jgi:hypothetical protein
MTRGSDAVGRSATPARPDGGMADRELWAVADAATADRTLAAGTEAVSRVPQSKHFSMAGFTAAPQLGQT